MQLDILKSLIYRASETRKKMYISHDRLRLNRTPENFEKFRISVDAFNEILHKLPIYMRVFPVSGKKNNYIQ